MSDIIISFLTGVFIGTLIGGYIQHLYYKDNIGDEYQINARKIKAKKGGMIDLLQENLQNKEKKRILQPKKLFKRLKNRKND